MLPSPLGAMRHRLQWFIHLLDREMSTPPTLRMGYGTPFIIGIVAFKDSETLVK